MGSPISLGHVYLGDYEDRTDGDLKRECMEIAQRIEASPYYICGINNRENLVVLHALLTQAINLLNTESEAQEVEINKRVQHFEFEGQR
jgi:hypothetical protein